MYYSIKRLQNSNIIVICTKNCKLCIKLSNVILKMERRGGRIYANKSLCIYGSIITTGILPVDALYSVHVTDLKS